MICRSGSVFTLGSQLCFHLCYVLMCCCQYLYHFRVFSFTLPRFLFFLSYLFSAFLVFLFFFGLVCHSQSFCYLQIMFLYGTLVFLVDLVVSFFSLWSLFVFFSYSLLPPSVTFFPLSFLLILSLHSCLLLDHCYNHCPVSSSVYIYSYPTVCFYFMSSLIPVSYHLSFFTLVPVFCLLFGLISLLPSSQ